MVADQTLVMVRKHGSATKYVARVQHVAHDWSVLRSQLVRSIKEWSSHADVALVSTVKMYSDLALLHVEDPWFWRNLPALEFADTPRLQEKVLVAGYPTGGDAISLSTGVVWV